MMSLAQFDDEYDDEFDLEPADSAPLDDRLEWELRKLAQVRDELRAQEALRDEWIDRYQKHALRVTAPLKDRIEYLEQSIKALMLLRLDENPRQKSVYLPSGIVVTRRGSTAVEVDDEERFVAWALENQPTWVRTPAPPAPKPNKTAIKGDVTGGVFADEIDGGQLVFKESGEVVPGLSIVHNPLSVSINTSGMDEE